MMKVGATPEGIGIKIPPEVDSPYFEHQISRLLIQTGNLEWCET